MHRPAAGALEGGGEQRDVAAAGAAGADALRGAVAERDVTQPAVSVLVVRSLLTAPGRGVPVHRPPRAPQPAQPDQDNEADGPATDGPATDGPPTDGPPTDGPPTDGPPTDSSAPTVRRRPSGVSFT